MKTKKIVKNLLGSLKVRSGIAMSCLLFCTSTAFAAVSQGTWGIGVLLGTPTAISGKYFMGTDRAIDAGLSFSGNHYTEIFSDYLVHFPGAFGRQNAFVANVSPYVGIGPAIVITDGNDDHHYHNGRLVHHHHSHDFRSRHERFVLGVRIPLGIEWIAPKVPVGISLEFVPGIEVIPSTSSFFEGGIAIRYYF